MDFEWGGQAFPWVIFSHMLRDGGGAILSLLTCWRMGTILQLFRACENKEKGDCHFFYGLYE